MALLNVLAGNIAWRDYRHVDDPHVVNIRHHKTGVAVPLPLEDDDGRSFYPELDAYLAELPRLGAHRAHLRRTRPGTAHPYSMVYAQRRVREARAHAGLGKHVTLDACRHGRLTEAADAGATDQGLRALSGHQTSGDHRPLASRPLDAERLIERWREGRSPQTLCAYSNDLRHFSGWLGKFLGARSISIAEAVTTLLGKLQGEASEIARAYRSAMIEQGLSPSTINRRLSALRSVALGKELGFVTFDLATKNVRAEAYRDTRGPQSDTMMVLLEYAEAQPNRAKAARDVAIFLLLGYGHALRRGEVVALDLEHFDPRGSRFERAAQG